MVERLLNISGNKRLKLSAVILGLLIAVIVIYFPNYARLRKLREENKRLVSENERLVQEIVDYQEKLKKVGKDPYLYEKIAREELGIAKEGEIVIDIEQ